MAHFAEGVGDVPESGAAQALLGVSAAAVLVVDDEGTVVGWTESAQQLLGHPPRDVVGRSVELVLALLATPRTLSGTPRSPSETEAPSETQAPPGAQAPSGPPTSAGTQPSPETQSSPEAEPSSGTAPSSPPGPGGGRAAPGGPGWAERTRAREPWSGTAHAWHSDGRVVPLNLAAVPMDAPAGRTRWLVSAVEVGQDGVRPAETGASLMRTLLDRSPIAVDLWDEDLRCVWLNTTTSLPEAFAHRRLGACLAEMVRGFELERLEGVLRQVLRDGRPVVDHEYRWTSPDGGEEHVISASAYRVERADGLPLGVCTTATDITRSWARERLAMVSEAGKRIGTTLDVMTTAQELADAVVPLLADYVTVDVAESVPLGGEPLKRLEPESRLIPVFRRAGRASVHSGSPESLYQPGEPVYVPPTSPFLFALETGESWFEPVLDTSEGTWLDADPARATRIQQTGMHSLLVLPLKARGDILGIVVLVRTENQAPFSRGDLQLAEDLVVRASLSLDNARRYTRERATAVALQRVLLPARLVSPGSVDVAFRYLPADRHEGVGGDWFDVIRLPRERVALVIGDVVGHGLQAAATMGRLRIAIRALASLDLPPVELLARLDDLAVHLSEESRGPDGLNAAATMATCVYAVYDPATGKCSLARAGHPPPAVLSPDGGVTFPRLPAGTPLGLGLASYESVSVELPEGSVLAMFTDGLIETSTADIATGLRRLEASLGHSPTELEELCSRVITSMLTQAIHEDDVALLLARTRTAAPRADG